MRVQVSGTSESAAVLRSYLHEAGDVVVWKDGDNSEPDYIIHLEERKAQEIYFESLQCDLERDIIRHVRQKAIVPIVLCGAPNNRPKHIIRIVFPPSQSPAVELGVQMGLADYVASKRKTAAELVSASTQSTDFGKFEEILGRFVDKIRPADSDGIKLAQQLEALYERLLLERDGAIETLKSELEEATNPPKVPASRPWWKWIWAAIFLATFVPTAKAQIYPIRPVIQFTNTNPNGNACTFSSTIQYYQGTQYTCANNATYAASGGGGSSSWSALTNPTGNLSLTMGADTSLWTFNATTGAGVDLFKATDTTNNTGTGNLVHWTTASGSAASPWQADANGVGAKLNSSGNLVSVSTSTLDWSAGAAVKLPVLSAKLTSTNASGQIAAAAAETAPITVSATGGIACGTCATTTNGGALSATSPVTISAAGVIACATCATTTNGGALSATAPVTISAAGVIACATCLTSVPWNTIANPNGNLSLTMAADTSLFTYNATTGAGVDLFELTDTTNNTGTGNLLRSSTTSGSAAAPLRADANGVGFQVNSTGNLVNLSTAIINEAQNSIAATSTDAITLTNSTAATSGAKQQFSPRIRWQGNTFTSGSVSQTAEWFVDEENRNVSSADDMLVFTPRINAVAKNPIAFCTTTNNSPNGPFLIGFDSNLPEGCSNVSGFSGWGPASTATGNIFAAWTNASVDFNINNNGINFGSAKILVWSSATDPGANTTGDTGLCRSSAAVLGINDGSATCTLTHFKDAIYQHTLASGTAPTLTAGTGTIIGGDEGFRVTLTAGSQTTVTVTFNRAYTTNIPVFTCVDETTAANNPVQAVPTLSTVVINATGTFGASDKISCHGTGIIGI